MNDIKMKDFIMKKPTVSLGNLQDALRQEYVANSNRIIPKPKGKENAVGTGAYLLGKAGEGAVGLYEGIADIGAEMAKGAGIATSWAVNNKVGKAIFGKEAGDYENNPLYQLGSQMQKDDVKGLTRDVISKEIQPYSYAKDGGVASAIAEGVGYAAANALTAGAMTPFRGASTLTKGQKALQAVARYTPTFTSTAGNEFTQSINAGNDYGKSALYAIGRGAIESGSEALFGGLGKMMGKGALDDVVVNSIAKRIKSTVGKKLAEVGIKAIGEGFEENISGILTPLLQRLTIDQQAKLYNGDQAIMDFLAGAATSAIMQTPSAIGDIRSNNKALNTLKSINEQLGNDNLTGAVTDGLNTIKTNLTNGLQDQNFTNKQIEQKTQPKPITPATNNVAAPQNNVFRKIEQDRPGLKIIESNSVVGNGLYVKTQDGSRIITINPNSPKATEFVLIHELAHDLSGTPEYNELKQTILNYDKGITGFEEARANLTSMYKDVYTKQILQNNPNITQQDLDIELNKMIDEEATNDVLGTMLSDQTYINKLSTQQPNIFQKIYRWINDMLKRISGKESKFLQDVKLKFENAYRQSNTSKEGNKLSIQNKTITTRADIRYSVSEDSGLDNYSDLSKEQKVWLSKVDKIRYSKNQDGTYNVEIINNNGDLEYTNSQATIENISNKIGTFLTKQIKNGFGSGGGDTKNIYKEDINVEAPELTQEEKTKVIRKAKRSFGTTSDFREAGYLTTDGSLLDFSEKKDGGTPGKRSADHREISVVGYDMMEFISQGHIRMKPESNGFEMTVKPTEEQFKILKRYIDNANGEIYIDINKNKSGNSYDSAEYKVNTPASKIISDINYYFANGKFPQKSELAQFRYSQSREGKWQERLNKVYEPVGIQNKKQTVKPFPTKEDLTKIVTPIQAITPSVKPITKTTPEMTTTENNTAKSVDYNLKPKNGNVILYHNTSSDNVDSILQNGLKANAGENIGRGKDGNFVWATSTPNYKGYGGNTIAFEIPISQVEQFKVNDDEYTIPFDVSKESIKFVDKPIYGENRISDVKNQIEKYGFEKTKEVFGKSKNKNISTEEFVKQFQPTNLAAAKEEDVLMVKSTDPTKAKSYNTKEEIAALETKQNRYAKVKEYRGKAKELISNIATWKDKSMGFKYSRETMERNIYDIIPNKQEAKRVVDEYITPITERNAQKEKFINSYNERIKALNLTHKESVAVQMWGEYRYNPDTTITQETMTDYIKKNNIDVKKMENAVETFRNIYDELIVKVNQVLKEQGYKEIPYRKGYFPHFVDEKATTILGKVAEKLGWIKRAPELPTSIAGMTDIFKPGKTWFGNALQRKGDITDYNALKGFDNYIRGISDQIFHTESIQKLRALENEIRYQYSDKGIQEEIDAIKDNDDLEIEQQEELIDNVFKRTANPMPNLVTELRKYTDSIANKKDIGDRAMEQQFGRGVYTVAKNVQKRLGANMVGLNISSALTNFIPLTQAYSQVSSKNMLGATAQTLKTIFNDDGFADKSTFLTNRVRQADTLYKTGLDKVSDKASFLFYEIDNVVSNIVVRGKYAENLQKNMSETEAMKDADQFAKNVIGGRDKGSMPTIFNKQRPMVKLVTTFQYEVNNQYSYMFKDLPRDKRNEGIARLTMAFIKIFIAAWLYNKGKEAVTGTKSAFSPFDIVEEAIKTIGNDSLSTVSKGKQISKSIAREVPFIGGLLGGGRLPIEAALPSLSSIDYAIKMISEESDEAKKTAANNLKKELLKPVFYLVPPFGGGQVKKTIEGLSMFDDKKAVSGSYTPSGKLRFPVEKTTGNVLQAALFGQYASKEAREYFDNERRMLSDNQLKELSKSDNIKRDYELLMNTRELNRLKTQRKALIEEGKSTTEIDKKIADLLKKGK